MLSNHKLIFGHEKKVLFLAKIYQLFNFFGNNEVRVLIYHHIQKNQYNLFLNQLFLIKKKWNFITPNQFENHINGMHKLKGKNVLLTFDDGFNSNFFIAKKILKKLKIKAIFFVPSDFVKINSALKSRVFIKKNILDQSLPSDFNTVRNMTINNLKELIKNGHLIGAHSKTHANLGSIINDKKLKNEIIYSAKNLEKILKIKIKHFAFTYGNYLSISERSLKFALSQYDFIYSSLRGNNFKNFKTEIIKRDAIYLEKDNKLLLIFLSGLVDLKYLFQIFNINKLIKKLLNN